MPGNDYTSKRLTVAQKGLNLQLEPTLMKGMYSPYMKNMMLENGSLMKFRGYSGFGDNGNLKSINGSEVGCALRPFIDYEGKTRVFAFTDKTGFVTAETPGETTGGLNFININPGVSVEQCSTGWTDAHADFDVSHDGSIRVYQASLEVASNATPADANKICYKNFSSKDLSGYTHVCGWIQVNFSPLPEAPLTLVISESADGAKAGTYVEIEIPVNDATPYAWRFFCVAVDLSSMNAAISIGLWNNASINWANGETVYFDMIDAITLLHHDYDGQGVYEGRYTFADVTDTDYFASGDGKALIVSSYSNQDDLLYWYSTTAHLQTLVHGIPNFSRTLCVMEFWNHFFIGGYKASSYSWNSLAHASIGDIDDWVSDGSGFYTLTDTMGKILRMTKNDYVANIYSEYSISHGRYYGSHILFTFPCIMDRLGLLGQGALVDAEEGDYFVGSDKRFYFMPLGQKPVSIGDAITPTAFDKSHYYTYRRSYLVCGKYGSMHRILFGLPYDPPYMGYEDFPLRVYAYNIITKAWEYYEFEHTIRDFAEVYIDSGNVVPYYDTMTLFIDKDCVVRMLNDPSEYETERATYPNLQVADSAFYPRHAAPSLTHTTPIANVTDLQNIKNDLDGNYYLTNDIDASATIGWNGGAGFEPIDDFIGTLDGCGYKISNLYINRPDENGVGLFGSLEGDLVDECIIYNLTLEDVTINGGRGTAPFAGYATTGNLGANSMTFQNCHVKGASLIQSTGATSGYVGGFVGEIAGGNYENDLWVYFYDCTTSCRVDTSDSTDNVFTGIGGFCGIAGANVAIYNCRATGAVVTPGDDGDHVGGFVGETDGVYSGYCLFVDCAATGSAYGCNDVGGFCGYNDTGSFTRCSARGNVTGQENAGGFFGYGFDAGVTTDCYAWGTVMASGGAFEYAGGFISYDAGASTTTRCYSKGRVIGTNIGGFCQYNDGSTYTSCFWDTDTSYTEESAEGAGHETDWMQTQSNYEAAGWDFDDVWVLDTAASELDMGGEDYGCEYQTEDVTIDDEHSNARWKWFTFTAKSIEAGSIVVVEYSIDNGDTWTAFDDSPVTLTSDWITHRIPLDIVSRVIRFRFTQTAGDLQIKPSMFYGYSQDTEV